MSDEIIELTDPFGEPVAIVRNKVIAIEGVHVTDAGRHPYVKNVKPGCLLFLIGTPAPIAIDEEYASVKRKVFG